MTETTEARAAPARRPHRRARWLATPSTREALWGFVFIGPWLIGLVALHGRPDHRLAGHVADRLQPRSDPRTIKFIGLDNYVQMASRPERRAVARS